jgi:hypothetical protein
MSTVDKLDYLNQTKQGQKEVLQSYNVEVTENTPFRQYQNKFVEGFGMKIEGVVEGLSGKAVHFDLDERDLSRISVIRRYALYNNANLKNLIIPNNVTSIDPNAFYGCTGLLTVKLPKNIRLQASCFNGCSGLLKVYLPDVENFGDVPTLGNINVFNSTTCEFAVSSQEIKSIYLQDSNWNTFSERFVVEVTS